MVGHVEWGEFAEVERGYRFGLRTLRQHFNLALGIVSRARLIAYILRKEKCEAVVVCTGGREIVDFPAMMTCSGSDKA